MKQLLVIFGSTSTGKTDLALKLAEKFNGELVACDSRQVYVGLDIGTGKAPSSKFKIQNSKFKKGNKFWEFNGVKIWMYDVTDPGKQYTVYDYVKDAERIIDEIFKRGKLPIIVGGTGLYLKALLEGLSNLAIPMDQKLRNSLETLSRDELQKKLQKISPQKWQQMNYSDRQNPRRLIRAVEIASTNFTSDGGPKGLLRGGFKTLKIGLTAPRQILYRRIDERVINRMNQGMLDEAERLRKTGMTFKRMRQLGLEYGVLADYLEGKIKNKNELIRVLQGKIHGFARRQITWFKKASLPAGREKNTFWFDITEKEFAGRVENLVAKWYD
ncbi:tRNA (adenosine(37)-N6)-dimethylallyltransferase MiaA [Candidatus Daviesbacteria bacterium RIFCSPLOWO2_02_FULL_41_8]|uniref:tRNA dimethylallyltransferase n=3 Tax=Candidatus Daviesiibacteriota TaxID=1752718 RepID=A0A1F5NLX8_9BACT|nr:MAG: tRNA (adenosine(37)-N6)-dimethylallyltransferase MiaA [Candidatus Daviesbacteria bacterium RIFCSPHIGHO2_01_FULL_41_23]OGE33738.1 MAG: tRNA (adenosine(37)-N6)-dimethylallyltransferase MiaA [Candidatus Daviesbacteria bacterium RIFCSPHIGHO2_02_FULL_41_10]OGE62172.1 MAG: tRNA (adenosine(37)-N6)-dimethylallyltransferase MiaA [Candidatus Daviesbacteria bacterium RIFCSPLOWO2_01_FULL_41_32]OGE78665.1 MAG: tRNA (adenosine(37)-N6)-dimethylallyltransferase MiaA [Candidatus Daviesbacteria bacterium 